MNKLILLVVKAHIVVFIYKTLKMTVKATAETVVADVVKKNVAAKAKPEQEATWTNAGTPRTS